MGFLVLANRSNKRKTSFLDSIPTTSIESDTDILTTKCKFNFAYFDTSQEAGQNFCDWSNEQLNKLMEKLCHYSEFSLKHWQSERIGAKNNKVLEVYGIFPTKSAFIHPKHVPHEAMWARFRLEGSVRLIGFVLPDHFIKQNILKQKKCLTTIHFMWFS